MKKVVLSVGACILLAYSSYASVTSKNVKPVYNDIVKTSIKINNPEEGKLFADCFYEVWVFDSKSGELLDGFSKATSASEEDCLGLALGAIKDFKGKYPNAIISYKVSN